MLGGRAESTLCDVADLYIVDFGGGEQERARREAEREVEHRRRAAGYARYLAASAGVGEGAPGARLFCPDCGQWTGEGS